MDKWIKILVLLLAMGPKTKAQGDLWKALPFQMDYQTRVMYYDSMDQVSYIAGNFTKVNDTVCNIIQWEGSSYTLLPSSPLYITSCLIRYHNKLYAGGYGLASWDGSSWTYLDSTAVILCFYEYNDKLLIGGGFNSIGGDTTIAKVAVWNDTLFTDMYRADTLIGSDSRSVASICLYKEQIYIGGNINNPAYPLINEIARFDGQKWTDVGGQLVGDGLAGVNNMLVWRDTLYIGGQFFEAVGSPGNAIASWDGSQWHRLGKGLLQPQPAVAGLRVYHDQLYATGWFYIVDGIDKGQGGHKGLAKWDGNKWCTMGTSADGPILYTGIWKDSLYLLGGFTTINDDTMQFIAQWIGEDYTDTCSDGALSIGSTREGLGNISVYPNPSGGMYHIRCYNTTGTCMVNISVVDLLGRTIYKTERKFTLGYNDVNIDLGTAAPGVYFLRIIYGTGQYSAKLQKE